MLTLTLIREKPDLVIERLAVKNFNAQEVVQQILSVDEKRRATQTELDTLLSHSNLLSKEIGELFKSGKKAETDLLKEKSTALKEESSKLKVVLDETEKQLQEILVRLPNLPSEKVPLGKSPDQNEMVHSQGEIPVLEKNALPHWELAAQYDIIDFDLGVKLTGAGFPVYKGKGARLHRGMINFFLDRATAEGYKEIQPPIMVSEDSGFGTGQLPDKEGQMYHVTADNLYLIPTAEVPVTNIYRDVILKEENFPVKMTAYTPCFRREAGSYGKDVRGLNRLHQFDKVEIVQIQHPDKSYETLEDMKNYVAGLLSLLELPFRIIKLCGGDMSFASALTYDFEVFSAVQQKWLEVSSVSNFESFQANRMKLRYKDSNGKTQLAHTLNGSALAFPRIVAALLENNQSEKGIRIPAALADYCGFEMID
ncbi:MAG TPA: serine--tRNA ligase [Bacteroidia bacterium]|nr:serine--tRNA ligase [Bacteroidia bacterium]